MGAVDMMVVAINLHKNNGTMTTMHFTLLSSKYQEALQKMQTFFFGFFYVLLVSHKLLISVTIWSFEWKEQSNKKQLCSLYTFRQWRAHTQDIQRCHNHHFSLSERGTCAFSKWVVSVLQVRHQQGWSEMKNKTKKLSRAEGRGAARTGSQSTLKMVALIWLSTSPPQRERRGMRKGFHMGFRLFITTCG